MRKNISTKKGTLKNSFDTLIVEKQIQEQLDYMDFHLFLLNSCVGDNDSLSLQKSQLNKIRQKLFELEYFSYETT